MGLVDIEKGTIYVTLFYGCYGVVLEFEVLVLCHLKWY